MVPRVGATRKRSNERLVPGIWSQQACEKSLWVPLKTEVTGRICAADGPVVIGI